MYTDNSFKNYLVWCLTMLVGAVVAGAMAIILGTIFEDSIQAALIINAYIMLNILGIGSIVNPSNANWF